MKRKPGEPETLDAGDFFAHVIQDGDRAVCVIPLHGNIGAVNTVGETRFAVLFKLHEGVGFVNAVKIESDNQLLGVIGIGCAVIDRKVKRA